VKPRSQALALVLVVAGLSAACGLSSEVRAEADRTSAHIDDENADIARKEAAYRTFAASGAYATYRVYAERETWLAQFGHARVKTAAARSTYQRYVTPLLKRNDQRDEQAVAVQLSGIARLIGEARAYADLPQRRRGIIDDIAASYARLSRASSDNLNAAKTAVASLMTERDRARNAFPARAADIDRRVVPVQQLADATARANQKVAFETANADAKRAADFVVLGDNAQLVLRNSSKVQEQSRAVGEQFKSLSGSYSKALADMKAAYFITIQRWAWNDSADSPSVHTYTYPRRELTGEAFDYFNALPESLPYAAKFGSSTFGGSGITVHPNVAPARWSALGIVPTEAWVNRDDSAEYGFTLSGDYSHKYLVSQNGQTEETDWQKVDETMFENHVDDLGMDLVAKPVGAFEDEQITNPTPAGLAFVGNPQYGQWQADNRGSSFWVWYGQYRLFSDLLGARGQPYLYRRDEWDTWSTRYRGQPYYGEDKDKQERYGTHGYVVGSSNRWASSIPEMRRVAVRHGSDAGVGRGGGFSRTGK
jgi:hypothetical protein